MLEPARSSSYVVLVLLCALFWAPATLHGQTRVPRDKVPGDLPADLRSAIERLYSSNPAERCYAVQDLRNLGPRATPAIPFLIGLLHDTTRVRVSSKERKGDEWSSPRNEALEALVALGPAAVDVAIVMLKDPNAPLRANAATALAELKDPRALEPLLAALKDSDRVVRANAATALGRLKDARAVESLLAALNDPEGVVRANAARALAWLKEPRALEPVLRLLRDPSLKVRADAVMALGELGDPRGLEPLMALLGDPQLSLFVPYALGMFGDRPAAAARIAALKDPGSENAYLKGFAELGKPEHAAELIAALGSKEPLIQRGAAVALQRLSGKNFGNDVARWQAWWEDNKKAQLSEAE